MTVFTESIVEEAALDWLRARRGDRARLRDCARPARCRARPDKQEKATQTVLEQAEVLSEAWALG